MRILSRTNRQLPREIKSKISLFCNVPEEAVITARDVLSIYEVPLALHEEGLDGIILKLLQLPQHHGDLTPWVNLKQALNNPQHAVNIGVVGKYVEYEDSYKSLNEALIHGGVANRAKVGICWVDSEGLTDDNCRSTLSAYDAILIPGGFGKRGIEGMLKAIRYAR
jgi:CTP synthase